MENKTLEQCKDEVAVRHGYSDFDQMYRVDLETCINSIDEIAESYKYRWIEIKSYKDLPKQSGDFIIYGRYTKDSPMRVFEAFYNNITKRFSSDNVFTKETTHWMNRPNVPKL